MGVSVCGLFTCGIGKKYSSIPFCENGTKSEQRIHADQVISGRPGEGAEPGLAGVGCGVHINLVRWLMGEAWLGLCY